ncbi:MAG: MFS transporter [Candidatus Heimdallarchaeota archaeon]|nr:MFS transporter [Candidatus Heimdallarchaeota archaeon]
MGAAFANYEPYAPFWLQELFSIDSYFITGLVVVIPSIAVAVGTAFWGHFADKYGIKRFVMLGLGSYFILFLSLIFTTNATYFLVAVLVGTIFGAAQSSNFYALGAKIINKPRTVVFAKMIATISLSWVILSPFVGWIGDSYEDTPLVAMKIQLILAVVLCTISIIFALFIKEKKPVMSEPVVSEPVPSIVKERKPLTFLPVLFGILMVVVFTWQITGGFWAYTSIYFLSILKIKKSYYALYLILKTALAVPLSILLGRVKKHSTNILIMVIFAIWSAVMYFFMMMFPLNWLMFLLIYSIPMYPVYSVTFQTIISNYTPPERRATAFGVMNAIGTSGYVGGILVLGIIADNFTEGIFAMLIASFIFTLVALSVIIVFYIYNRLRKDKLESAKVL